MNRMEQWFRHSNKHKNKDSDQSGLITRSVAALFPLTEVE